MDKKQLLIEKAREAFNNSYSPYSHFAVGAALLCADGTVFLGTNVENASYGLTMCAERNALFQAYSNGKRKNDFIGLAIIADTEKPIVPCGACRQVIIELFNKLTPIFLCNLKGDVLETNIEKLLPSAFEKTDLK